MKQTKGLLVVLVVLILLLTLVPAGAALAAATKTNITGSFTDPNFLAALRDVLSKDASEPIYNVDIEGMKGLSLDGWDIANLDGIELFTDLEVLWCHDNQLTTLDMSHNPALRTLHCRNNQLTALNVSNNPALETLICDGNRLTALGVSNNTALWNLHCSNNQLAALDVSKNAALWTLDCSYNQLTALDLGENTALESLVCFENRLTVLDVSKNIALAELWCDNNQLTALGVNGAIALETLNCFENQLTELDVSNNTALTRLDCSDNQLTALVGVSKNTALEQLDCGNNQLTALDVSKNIALDYLGCRYNQLTALDVSKNIALAELWCDNNQLTALDVSQNTALNGLYCHSNQLIELDVSKNAALTGLVCNNNQLTTLNVSNNPALNYLYIDHNKLPSLSAIVGLDNTQVITDELETDFYGQPYFRYTPQNTGDGKEYSYTNLSYSFEWETGWGTNSDAVGGCTLSFRLSGDLTGIAAVLIAVGTPTADWTPTSIQEQTEFIIPIWKNAGVISGGGTFDGYVTNGFPIDEDELGMAGEILCLVLDQNCDALGYVLIPVTLPSEVGGGGTPGGSFTLTQAGITYGQTLADPRVAGSAVGAVTYSYSGTLLSGAAYGPISVKPSEAGRYTVTGADTSGHTASADFTIAPKALTLSGLSVVTKTYDRSVDAVLTGTPVLTGKVGTDDVAVSAGTAVFDSAVAGANKNVSVTGLTLTGAKAFNYTLPATLSLKGEIKALSAGDAPLVTPNLSGSEQVKLTDTPPIYNADPATDAELWDMVYKLREDTAFRSVTPESSANLLFMDLTLVLTSDGTTPYTLKPGESLNVVFPYPSAAVAQNYKNYRFVLLHYTSGDETEIITIKAESYGIEATLTELSPYALAWTQISSGSRSGGGGGGAQPPVVPTAPITVSKATLSYISGINRVETSVTISRQGWTSAETVILAPGGQNNLIDALTVAPLAGQEKAPILLTTGSLDPAIVTEIQRLGAKKIYAVGAISQDVIDALQVALPGVTVEVLKGSNRFETANLVGAKLTAPQGTFVVGYNAIADAVSAASFAAANGYVIQIANPNGSVSAAPTGTAYVLGGPTLVSDVAGATRLYGATRYETNKAIRDALTFEYTNIYTADGNTLVDALTGSALAAQTKAAIVLLPGNDPTGVDFGKITTETKVYAFGGAK
ncbi:MAG: cell wall-binding repeat-containing protein [Gracilibacteraceae bacterium]|jgi:Leucine-rich repeat (LRR) protein|nr:cell wall-binding repeat-containing protein [Gracilibacteraceae bacterium]